jgi:hypothetical protein
MLWRKLSLLLPGIEPRSLCHPALGGGAAAAGGPGGVLAVNNIATIAKDVIAVAGYVEFVWLPRPQLKLKLLLHLRTASWR